MDQSLTNYLLHRITSLESEIENLQNQLLIAKITIAKNQKQNG